VADFSLRMHCEHESLSSSVVTSHRRKIPPLPAGKGRVSESLPHGKVLPAHEEGRGTRLWLKVHEKIHAFVSASDFWLARIMSSLNLPAQVGQTPCEKSASE